MVYTDFNMYFWGSALNAIGVFAIVMLCAPFLIWVERKALSVAPDDIGPHRGWIFGIRIGGFLYTIADVFRFFVIQEKKQGAVLSLRTYFISIMALVLAIFPAALIPFSGNGFWIFQSDAALLIIMAFIVLGTSTLLVASFDISKDGSNLWGLKTASRLISYDLVMILVVISIFMISKTFSLVEIVIEQGPYPWNWLVFKQPLSFALFSIALFAKASWISFDPPSYFSDEAPHSPAIAALTTAQYIKIFVGALIVSTLFFGGYEIPFLANMNFLGDSIPALSLFMHVIGSFLILFGILALAKFKKVYLDLRDYEVSIVGVLAIALGLFFWFECFWFDYAGIAPWFLDIATYLAQFFSLIIKTVLISIAIISIRIVMPRMNFEKAMRIGWKIMIPLAMLNILLTGALIIIFKE